LEGTVSKQINSPYVSKRTRAWIKVKCRKRQEFVVGGWTDAEGARTHLGALLLGWYAGDDLRYCGRVGTGFTAPSLRFLASRLKPLEVSKAPFANPPPRRGFVHWASPRLVAEVEFANWTQDGILRQAVFLGLRHDKPPRDVTREEPAPERRRKKPGNGMKPGSTYPRSEWYGVRLTHPDRVVFPEQGLTKRDLAEYYVAVADWALPHMIDRPLTLVRCPVGRAGGCFYQRHVASATPQHIHPIAIPGSEGVEKGLSIRDQAGLVELVQMSALEIHVWGSRHPNVEKADRLVFDLDPDPRVAWAAVIDAARTLREWLERANLASFVRTTGGKGVHLVVPIFPEHEWPVVKRFARQVAEALVRRSPDRFIATASKAKRKGKIFVDYLRNDRSATAIATYSTRAREGAPVALPIQWKELTERMHPSNFTVLTVPKRLARLRVDPWDGFANVRQRLRIE
jgi:bifunctional non-homologous end joining protein LigD